MPERDEPAGEPRDPANRPEYESHGLLSAVEGQRNHLGEEADGQDRAADRREEGGGFEATALAVPRIAPVNGPVMVASVVSTTGRSRTSPGEPEWTAR